MDKTKIKKMWIADQGDGTYINPILYTDYSDPDAIRVGEDFFLIASSFCNTPAIPLLHSRDLVNWKVINYVMDRLPFDYYDKPMHGYIIVQQAAHSPMFGGKKPDATGIYRALKRMEEAELVTSEWETPEEGSAKRLFTLTDKGRHCLRRWIDALACYELTLEELRGQAAQALGIDLPDAPICSHEE